MTLRLAPATHSFVRLAEADEWVDMICFRLHGNAGDRAVLAELVEHELYGCDYAGGAPGADPARHGPYWRHRIAVDSFDRVGLGTAEAELPTCAELHQHLSRAERVHRLRELGADSVHDWGWVLYEFQEFVLIGQDEVTLVVSAID
jgi:hypothetical protein